jgi:iron-sulfur cluster repair protein YtfE (RIC family)
MLDRLARLSADTHLHVHKENNILFPPALALESAR